MNTKILCIILITGCAGVSNDSVRQATIITGQSIETVKDQYITASRAFRELCTSGVIAKQTCDEWAIFQSRFRMGYSVVAKGYAAGAGGIQGNDAAWESLVKELAHFVFLAVRPNQQDGGVQ